MKKHENQFHQDSYLPGQGKKTKQQTDSAIFFVIAVIGLIITLAAIYFS